MRVSLVTRVQLDPPSSERYRPPRRVQHRSGRKHALGCAGRDRQADPTRPAGRPWPMISGPASGRRRRTCTGHCRARWRVDRRSRAAGASATATRRPRWALPAERRGRLRRCRHSCRACVVQVLPPSTERNTPRIALAPYGCPNAATSTTSGLVGSTRMRPICCESSSPVGCQVRPASPGSKDACTLRDIRAHVGLAGADVDDSWI